MTAAVRMRMLPQSSVFAGPGKWRAIQALNIPHMRDRHSGGWLVPTRHGDDVLAWLENHGHLREAIL